MAVPGKKTVPVYLQAFTYNCRPVESLRDKAYLEAFSALLPGQVTIFGLDNPIACLYNTKIRSSIIKDCFFGTNSVKSQL